MAPAVPFVTPIVAVLESGTPVAVVEASVDASAEKDVEEEALAGGGQETERDRRRAV